MKRVQNPKVQKRKNQSRDKAESRNLKSKTRLILETLATGKVHFSAHVTHFARSIEINQNKHTDGAIRYSYRKLQRRLQLSNNELRFAKRRNRCIKKI